MMLVASKSATNGAMKKAVRVEECHAKPAVVPFYFRSKPFRVPALMEEESTLSSGALLIFLPVNDLGGSSCHQSVRFS